MQYFPSQIATDGEDSRNNTADVLKHFTRDLLHKDVEEILLLENEDVFPFPELIVYDDMLCILYAAYLRREDEKGSGEDDLSEGANPQKGIWDVLDRVRYKMVGNLPMYQIIYNYMEYNSIYPDFFATAELEKKTR